MRLSFEIEVITLLLIMIIVFLGVWNNSEELVIVGMVSAILYGINDLIAKYKR